MRFWYFVIVFALAIGMGVIIRQDPGYALFAYGNWSIEMPLWLCVVLLVLGFASMTLTLWFISTLFSGSHKVRIWWKKHQELTARRQTYKGLLALAEGRWQNAERYLSQSAKHSDNPLINYLSAAKAAEEAGSGERRNRYLQAAFDISAGSDVAVRLTQAQLQLKHGELEQSIQNLQRLYQESPKHPQVLRLLCTLYEVANDWPALFTLLPALRNNQIFSKEKLTRLEQKVYPILLPFYIDKSVKSLMNFWEESPTSIQWHPPFIHDYAKLLMQKEAHEEAEVVLRGALKKIQNDDLIHLYGLVMGRNPKKQLSFAESLQPECFNHALLLLTMGRLAVRNQLWGKATDYLEKSLSLKPLAETYAELGQLMDRLGRTEKRDEYFKKGLLMATQLTPIPIPSTTGSHGSQPSENQNLPGLTFLGIYQLFCR
jgi:HemY protein